jgi:exopolysaccharide biosynthesis polyprenyl glycosylphosphotransferase
MKEFAKTRRLIVLVDVLSIIASTVISIPASSIFRRDLHVPIDWHGTLISSSLVVLFWVGTLASVSAWDSRLVYSGTQYYVRLFRGTINAFGIVSVFGFVAKFDDMRLFVVVAFPVGVLTTTFSRWSFRQWFRTLRNKLRIFVIAHSCSSNAEILSFESNIELEIVGRSHTNDVEKVLSQIIASNVNVVFVEEHSALESWAIRELIWALSDLKIELWVRSFAPTVQAGRTIVRPVNGATIFLLQPVHLTSGQSLLKRVFDVVFSGLFMVILLPILVVSSLAVLLLDGRPVFYSQTRVGMRGEVFRLWKLRTMRPQSGHDFGLQYEGGPKGPNDPRVTPLGSFLRRWSIDEIPQLVNVFSGSMSLVGPRPRLSSEIESNRQSLRRLQAKPGLTGLWQTAGRADVPLDEAMAIDLNYVDSWTFLGDLAILLRTVKAVLGRRGAY